MRERLSIIIFTLLLITAGLIFPAKVSAEPLWPHLYGQVGPYGIKGVDELTASASAGFHLFVNGYIPPTSPLLPVMAKTHTKYIDTAIWNLFYKAFGTRIATKQPWTFTADEEQAFLSSVSQHLATTAQDSNVVGYYILDDYPGIDIHELLEKVHALVATANQTSIFPRPTVCAFGGTLDAKTSADGPYNTSIATFTRAITNFSPTACDVVSFYPYATNSHSSDPSFVDWSMTSVLPKELALLKTKGWDQSIEPLIGIPQTFSFLITGTSYYVLPTAENVAAQVTAYCQAGAIALLPYAWDDSHAPPKSELYNTPELVQGMQQGVSSCKSQYWNDINTTAPTISFKGESTIHLSIGDTFTDPGVTARDDIDGDLTNDVTATGSVDTTTAGNYSITYTVSDNVGNKASAMRTVIVDAPVPATLDTDSGTVSGGGGAVVTPVPEQAPSNPISSIISSVTNLFVSKDTPPPVIVTPTQSTAQGSWIFIPSSPTIPSPTSSPATPSKGTKRDYTIKSVQYVLNGTPIHTSTAFPDDWNLDTKTLADGTYTLNTTLYYADGKTEVTNQTFTVDNTPTLASRIITFFKSLFK